MAVKRSSKSQAKDKKPSGGSDPAAGPAASADDRMLHADFARMAGITSLAMALVGIAALVIYLVSHEIPADMTLYFAGWIVLGVLAGTAGAALLTGRAWAQRFLLVFWLLLSALAFIFGLTALLWETPGWWSKSVSLAWVAWPTVVLAAGAAVLAVMASATGSRLRYASIASVTVVAALTVAAAANLIAHKDYVHKDYGSRGIYGVSKWTQNILANVDKPLTLTCIYMSTEADKEGSEYRQRVMELLGEIEARMRKLDKEVLIANVTTDAERAKVFRRLQGRLKEQAAQHVKFLMGFDKQANELTALLGGEKKAWSALGEGAYLAQWHLPGQFQDIADVLAKSLLEVGQKIRKQMKAGKAVDYPAMITDVRTELDQFEKSLGSFSSVLKRLEKISSRVGKNGKGALSAADEFGKALGAAAKALGAEGQPVKDPKAMLTSFSEALVKAARLAGPAAQKLQNVGGEDNAALVVHSRCWQFGQGRQRIGISEFYEAMAEELADVASNARATAQLLAPEIQQRQIPFMRKALAAILASHGRVRDSAEAAMKTLAGVDQPSRDMMATAAKDKLFGPVLAKIKSLKDRMGKGETGLPELKADAGGKELTKDNLVVVEVGDQFRIVRFDEVFPRRARQRRPGDDQEAEKRVFNGDSAISSKILSMTKKPFATVYVTYLPSYGGQMAAMPWIPDSFFSPKRLQALSQRLREANFEVKLWYLDKYLEIRDDGRPQVLLVVPPSPPGSPPQRMRQRMRPLFFGPEHLAKIRTTVESGVGAIFLTGQARWGNPYTGQPAFQEINDYLRSDWGIEVKPNHKCLAGVPDETKPGWYKVDMLSLNYLPLSTFTDHAIGKPLRGQRMLWSNATAPLVRLKGAALPAGVTSEPLLRVPEYRKDIWAVDRFSRLISQIEENQGGLVKPSDKDMKPPFDLAVVAERKAAKADNAGAKSFAAEDILDWKALWTELGGIEDSAPAGPAKRIWKLLGPGAKGTLTGIKKDREEWDKLKPEERLGRAPDLTAEQKGTVADALGRVLNDPKLYDPRPRPPMPGQPPMGPPVVEDENFRSVALPREAQLLLDHKEKADAQRRKAEEAVAAEKPAPPQKVKPFTREHQRRFNRLLLEAAMPKIFASTQSIKAAKIVALGTGMSFFDDYLDRPVLEISSKGGVNLDSPPRAGRYHAGRKKRAVGSVRAGPADFGHRGGHGGHVRAAQVTGGRTTRETRHRYLSILGAIET